MKTVAIIQARMGSTRLPGKVMMDLAGMPVLGWVVRAAKAAKNVNRVVVVSPDGEILEWCIFNGIECYWGDESDVLSRFRNVAWLIKPGLIVRLTADCPFLDPDLIDDTIANGGYIGGANTLFWPDGMDVQVFRPGLLHIDGAADKEHVLSPECDLRQLPCSQGSLRHIRLTLDTSQDLERLRLIAKHLPADRPPKWTEVLDTLSELKSAA